MGRIIILIFPSLLLITNAQEYDYKFVLYNQLGNCVKCVTVPTSLILMSINEAKSCDIEVAIEARVKVNRKKKLKIFKDNYDWQYDLKRADSEYIKKYDIQLKEDILIFDSNDSLLVKLKTFENFNIDSLSNKIKNVICKENS